LEYALEVDDIEQFGREIRGRGITPVDLLGNPIEASYIVAASGNRYFYLPKAKTRGTSIEIIQVMTPPK
jgi:hypothetical protein